MSVHLSVTHQFSLLNVPIHHCADVAFNQWRAALWCGPACSNRLAMSACIHCQGGPLSSRPPHLLVLSSHKKQTILAAIFQLHLVSHPSISFPFVVYLAICSEQMKTFCIHFNITEPCHSRCSLCNSMNLPCCTTFDLISVSFTFHVTKPSQSTRLSLVPTIL